MIIARVEEGVDARVAVRAVHEQRRADRAGVQARLEVGVARVVAAHEADGHRAAADGGSRPRRSASRRPRRSRAASRTGPACRPRCRRARTARGSRRARRSRPRRRPGCRSARCRRRGSCRRRARRPRARACSCAASEIATTSAPATAVVEQAGVRRAHQARADHADLHHPACSRSHSAVGDLVGRRPARSRPPSRARGPARRRPSRRSRSPRPPRQNAVEVDVALPERAEQPAPPGGQRVGALGLHAREHVEPHVLDVDGLDPVAPVARAPAAGRRRRRRGARSRAAAATSVSSSRRSISVDASRRRSTCGGGRRARSRARGRRRRRARRRRPARRQRVVVEPQRRVLAAAAGVGDPLRPARVAQHRAGVLDVAEAVERRVQLGQARRPGR